MKLSRIVTNYCLFSCPAANDSSRLDSTPALDVLVATLVRSSAHEVIIPYVEPGGWAKPLYDAIAELPPSLAERVRVVDKRHRMRDRVRTYLEPLNEDSCREADLVGQFAFDILYKICLGARYEAEIDISKKMVSILGLLESKLHGEAKARMSQLIGILNLYDSAASVPVSVLKTGMVRPSVYERVSDFLDEAETQHYSHQRYLLGVPSKFKIALIELNKRFRRIRT